MNNRSHVERQQESSSGHGTMWAVDFAATIDRIEALLAPGHWRWAVAGGVALAAYGHPRTTLDVDIVAERAAQEVLIPAVEALGYKTLYVSDGFSNHRHDDPAWGRLDVIYVNAVTADQLFASTRELPGPGGRRIPVPKPEHLIAMKLQAIQNAPERTWQDLADIGYLLKVKGVDRIAARSYFDKAGLMERWDEFERLR